MVATRHANSPSDSWLLGATLSGYLIIAFVLRFWGEGLLFPASDIGYINGPPPESHPGLIVFVLVGVFITLLGVLQTIFFVQGSEKLTRFSLWLNFLAIFCLGLAAFGTKWIEGPLDFIVLVATESPGYQEWSYLRFANSWAVVLNRPSEPSGSSGTA